MINHYGKFLRLCMLFFIPLVIFSGCSKSLTNNTDTMYVPTAADATSTATLADLQAGRTVFINNCGRCHSLHNPDSFSAASWKSIIPMMAPKAWISAAETVQVTKYVTRGK